MVAWVCCMVGGGGGGGEARVLPGEAHIPAHRLLPATNNNKKSKSVEIHLCPSDSIYIYSKRRSANKSIGFHL